MTILNEMIKKAGTGSDFFDRKYGVRAVNKAIRLGLDSHLIWLDPGTIGSFVTTRADYGFKAALRHRNFSIIKPNR